MTPRLKRIYLPPAPEDGTRVLVDRLWPRGLSKQSAAVDHWLRDVAPSDALRRWFHHQVALWSEFEARYRAELAAPERQAALALLAGLIAAGPVTLLYGARDELHNQARILAAVLAERG